MTNPKPIFFGMSGEGEDGSILSPDTGVSVTTTIEIEDETSAIDPDPAVIEEVEVIDDIEADKETDESDKDEDDREDKMFNRIHSYLDITETVTQVSGVLDKHGCTQVTADLLHLEDITTSLGMHDIPSLESLPPYLEYPDGDPTTQQILSMLDDRVTEMGVGLEGYSLPGLKDELQSMLEYLDPRIRYIRNNAKLVLSKKLSEAKLKTQVIRMPDYDDVQAFLPEALKNIQSNQTYERTKRLRELNEWFANLDSRVTEYNNLCTIYINWYRDTFDKPVPTNVFIPTADIWSTYKDYRRSKRKMFSNRYKEIVWDSDWYKNRNKAITDGLKVCNMAHYSKSHLFDSVEASMSALYGKLRYNRIKTVISKKFDLSLSTLLRMASIDIELHRLHTILINRYLHWCVMRLIYHLNRCAVKPSEIGKMPKISRARKKKK